MRFSPGLQGLRGIAALVILLYHVPLPLMAGGWIGVDVFFVLSGYLVTRQLSAIELRSFYRRRIVRLIPPLAVLLAVATVVGLLRHEARPPLAFIATFGYGSNVLVATGSDLPGLGHLWTLAEEMQFYVIWPLVFVGCLRLGVKPWVAAIAGAALSLALALLSGRSFTGLYYAPDTHALPLLAGCALAATSWRPDGRLFALGLLALVPWLAIDAGNFAPALLIVTLLSVTVVASETPFLAHPVLRRLGDYSYGIYLWHWWLFAEIGRGWAALPALPLTLLLAALSFHLVEKPLRPPRLIRDSRPAEPERVLAGDQVHDAAGVLIHDRLRVVSDR